NYHPSVGQTFTTYATIHNNSPYSASNVNIKFLTDSIYYGETVLPYIGPFSTATVSLNFTYNIDGFYPIKVWIDSANVLGETNVLNNYA
ncbi:CARDB domain-containing protein, partial [Enterococcus faecium]